MGIKNPHFINKKLTKPSAHLHLQANTKERKVQQHPEKPKATLSPSWHLGEERREGSCIELLSIRALDGRRIWVNRISMWLARGRGLQIEVSNEQTVRKLFEIGSVIDSILACSFNKRAELEVEFEFKFVNELNSS